MSERTEKVQQFRDTIDAVIGDMARKVDQRRVTPVSILDYRKIARFGGMTFASLDRRDGRPASLGFNEEHMWAVLSDKLRLLNLGRTASMAVISTPNQPDTLIRRFSIDSAMQMIDVPTQITLDTDRQLDDALAWARMPHMASEAFDRLCLIGPDEIEAITPRLRKIDQEQRSLDDDLRRLSEMRQRSSQQANNIILG